MRVVIAGSRTITDLTEVEKAVAKANFNISVVISGGANGVDKLAEEYAIAHGLDLETYPVTPEDWARYGRSAGPRRNAEMIRNADGLIAIWDGSSSGTENTIKLARRKRIPIYIHLVEI